MFGSNLCVGEDWARQRMAEWVNETIKRKGYEESR